MLTKEEKNKYREELFRHLDGIGVAPVAYALKVKGVLEYILKEKETSLDQITDNFEGNEGYLNVGLRMLASQGWLDYSIDDARDTISITANELSSIAFQRVELYEDVVKFMKVSAEFHPRHFDQDQFSYLNRIFNKYKKGDFTANSKNETERQIEAQVERHIEGVLVGPITVFLGMDGMFHKYFMEASFSADEFHEDPESFSKFWIFSHTWDGLRRRMNTIDSQKKACFLLVDLRPME